MYFSSIIANILSQYAVNLYEIKNFKYTYIKFIDTPTYPDTKKVLEEFNAMGDNKIVSFSEMVNGRPIEISEMQEYDVKFDSDAIGIAYFNLTKCSIKIKKGLPYEDFRETIIHEYLHCYGYHHSTDPGDLMYYAINPIDKEQNIKDYAQKVKKKFYE